jgi:hypothetical protein
MESLLISPVRAVVIARGHPEPLATAAMIASVI